MNWNCKWTAEGSPKKEEGKWARLKSRALIRFVGVFKSLKKFGAVWCNRVQNVKKKYRAI